MPTVIDTLVVELGLDPGQFDDGKRRMVDALRQLEESAKRGGDRVTEAVKFSTVGFFRTLEHPLSSLRQHFEKMATYVDAPKQQLRDLGDLGRRTGEDVTSGALAGARGLRVLGAVSVAVGTAGLVAFSAYEALTKAIGAAGGAAQKLYTTGIGAQTAGIGVRGYSAIGQEFLVRGKIPQEQTQATLAQWKEMQDLAAEAAGTPAGQAAINQLVTMGVGLGSLRRLAPGFGNIDVWHGDVERNMIELARAIAAVPENRFSPGAIAAALGGTVTEQQVYGLRQIGALPPAQLQAEIDKEFARGATKEQEKKAEDLLTAQNNFAIALDNFRREFLISGLAEKLARLLDWLSSLIGSPESTTPSGHGGAPARAAAPVVSSQRFSASGPVDPALATGVPGIMSAARAGGANNSAVAVMLSAAAVEGGLGSNSWLPNAKGSGAVGRWQFLPGAGELPRYLAEGNRPGDDAAQTRYTLKRANEIYRQMYPGRSDTFSTTSDQAAQVAVMTKFENSGQGPAYYAARLAEAKRLMGKTDASTAWAGASAATPGFQSGGVVRHDQVARLHAGEVVFSALATGELARSLASIRRDGAGAGAQIMTVNRAVTVDRIIVNAPVREARAIAGEVAERVRRVSLAASANTGLE